MSTLGKILALVNMFGAVGLVCLASMDYAKRQSWAYAVLRHDLLLNGFPLDDSELDDDGSPRVLRLSDETLANIFGQIGGNPRLTQRQEVEAVKQGLDQKVQAVAGNPVQQTYLLARILLPLVDTYKDREQLLACRTQLANDQQANELKRRCRQAHQEGLRAGKPGDTEPTFAKVFRAVFRAQPGGQADAFVSELLVSFVDDKGMAKAVPFDAGYDEALERQRKKLEGRYSTVFNEALGATVSNSLGEAPDESMGSRGGAMQYQKAAIARLLLALCQFQSEEPNAPSYAQQVQRVYTVCGVRMSLNMLAVRATELRRMNDYVSTATLQDRVDFIADHNNLIGQLRAQAALVLAELKVLNENKDKAAAAEEVVKQRKTEIASVTAELNKARAETAQEIDVLRSKSLEVLKLRQKLRDAIVDISKGEQRLRELEKQIRSLDEQDR